MRARFWKMSGAGNDFVLLSGLPRGRSGAALARRLCDRHDGVGADGLLILSKRNGNLRLDYWNADGSSAFCGNGSRCAALWAKSQGWTKENLFVLGTTKGPLTARILKNNRAEISMPTPNDLRLGLRLKVLGRTYVVHYVQVGVPHAVLFIPNLDKIDVINLGRTLRFHGAFGPAGANVDFVQIKKGVIYLRTYERGVEDETKACGTGAVASAFVSCVLGKTGPSTRVKVRGGDILKVSLSDVAVLEGPGEMIFTGEVEL